MMMAIKSTLERAGYTVFSLSFENLGQNLFSSDEKLCAADSGYESVSVEITSKEEMFMFAWVASLLKQINEDFSELKSVIACK